MSNTQAQNAAPIYRADIKGQVAEFIEECTACMRNELSGASGGFGHGGDFIFTAEETAAYSEYKNFLTHAELERCFKRAQS